MTVEAAIPFDWSNKSSTLSDWQLQNPAIHNCLFVEYAEACD